MICHAEKYTFKKNYFPTLTCTITLKQCQTLRNRFGSFSAIIRVFITSKCIAGNHDTYRNMELILVFRGRQKIITMPAMAPAVAV